MARFLQLIRHFVIPNLHTLSVVCPSLDLSLCHRKATGAAETSAVDCKYCQTCLSVCRSPSVFQGSCHKKAAHMTKKRQIFAIRQIDFLHLPIVFVR